MLAKGRTIVHSKVLSLAFLTFHCRYQRNADTELARQYSHTTAPLENHHLSVARGILSEADNDIFANVVDGAAAAVQTDLSRLILATDMGRHAAIMQEFSSKLAAGHLSDPSQLLHGDGNLDCLKVVLIKACDISNECRPLNHSRAWADCLMKEYFMQVCAQFLSP